MLFNGTSQESVSSVTNKTSDDGNELMVESSIALLYPLVGLGTIAVSSGLLALGIRDRVAPLHLEVIWVCLSNRVVEHHLPTYHSPCCCRSTGPLSSCSRSGRHKKSNCNGQQTPSREIFAKRATNRRRRQNADRKEQTEALKQEVIAPAQDPRDFEERP